MSFGICLHVRRCSSPSGATIIPKATPQYPFFEPSPSLSRSPNNYSWQCVSMQIGTLIVYMELVERKFPHWNMPPCSLLQSIQLVLCLQSKPEFRQTVAERTVSKSFSAFLQYTLVNHKNMNNSLQAWYATRGTAPKARRGRGLRPEVV